MEKHPQITSDMSLRDAFGHALVAVGRQNPNVVALTADLAESTRCHWFEEEFPQRFFELGVAEQNMMSIAAGMALTGKVPFVCSFAVFNPGRNWDQFRTSVCYSKTNVKVVGSHAGFSNGGDGGTHQALEDIAITRCLPNVTVISPATPSQTYDAVVAVAKIDGPVYLRLSKSALYHLPDDVNALDKEPFHLGRAQVIRSGKDITLIATGLMVAEAVIAAEHLAKDGIDAEVINVHTIKPLDVEQLQRSLKKTGCGVTIEEHQRAGGLGSAVLEAMSECKEMMPVPIEVMGVNDQFGESGPPAELAAKHGLTATHLVHVAKRVLHRKHNG